MTELGLLSTELLSDRLTTVPAAGATAERVTVQVMEEPPTNTNGLQLNELNCSAAGGCTMTVVVTFTPFMLEVIVTV